MGNALKCLSKVLEFYIKKISLAILTDYSLFLVNYSLIRHPPAGGGGRDPSPVQERTINCFTNVSLNKLLISAKITSWRSFSS